MAADCQKCGRAAKHADDCPTLKAPTDADARTWREVATDLGPHGTFSLWLIDHSDTPGASLLQLRADGKSLTGTVEEWQAVAQSLQAYREA